jgi:ATP-dependent RNA helicase DeaD
VEQDVTETAGVTRGLNAVFVQPPDRTRAASFLAPALDRLDASEAATQLLIVTADPEAAMALAAAAGALGRAAGLTALAATSVARAARLLRERPAHVVAGDAATLVGLLQHSALKLGAVRQVVLAWPDDTLDQAAPAIETLFGEVPKDAARTLVVREISPAVEELIERYARRARRVLPPAAVDEAQKAWPVEYLSVHDETRASALRRLLDALDPPRAFVFARDDETRAGVLATLATLGYRPDGAVRAGAVMDADSDLLVLADLPATTAELRELTAGHAPGRIVALAQPRQLAALREVAAGVLNPFALPEATARARSQEEKLRDALRAILLKDAYSRELLTLEPLLAEFDGIEIAAAAVRLLEVERARAAAPPTGLPPKMARLFINAGESDGIRAGDLVGAIANVGGLTGRDVGRVELRDRHALVEVPEPVAEAVAEKLTGVTIKGRQIIARLDVERPARPGGGNRGERGDRGDRGPRPDRGERSDRGPRSDRGDRGPRSGPPRGPHKKWEGKDR